MATPITLQRRSARAHRPRHAYRQRPSRLGRLLFPPTLRTALRLVRSTPGLSVYVGGGLAVWLLCRTLVGHGLASSPIGALAVGALRVLGLTLVAVLYFRRTGHLAQAHADLRTLRQVLAERKPWRDEPARHRRWLFRLLCWSLRVRA